jgi:signal transduction histidine kinase
VSRQRRWGFRARLVALIAVVLIAGGAVLLGVQYVLVQQLFAQGISTISTGCFSSAEEHGGASIGDDVLADLCTISAGQGSEVRLGDGRPIGSVVVQGTTALSDEVLSGLLMWSIIVLAIFAGVAVLAAWWLAKRSLGRIAAITEATKSITRDDLHRRLDLPGPADEIKELGDTIDGMLDRLDDAFTRQDRFIAGASHELRTPLTTTRTLLEIPLAQGRVPSDLEPALRGALAANARSERLIAALLALARLPGRREAGAGVLRADLARLAAESLAEHDAAIRDRSLRPSGPTGPAVLAAADPELARIAIGNLVGNAVRHNRPGGELAIRSGRDDRSCWVEVRNDGRDLTAIDPSTLTEAFHRGEESRLAGDGLGLGLSLVETIARSLGGSLVLTPRPEGGLSVRLSLPASTGAASDPA